MGKGEGKGEGKGGCLEELCDALAAGVACLCCLLLAGPVLIIVGIVFLVSTGNDDRSDRINQFNELTAAWNDYGFNDFSTNTSFGVEFSFLNCVSQGQVSGGPFVLLGGANPSDSIGGDSKRVSFQQWKYSLTSLPSQVINSGGLSSGCQMKVDFLLLNSDGTQQDTLGSAQGTVQTTITTNVCDSSQKSSSCRQHCQNQYGGSYNSFSRQCTYSDTLSGICIKVDESSPGVRDWTENDQLPGAGTGCYWNRDSNVFEETKTKRNGDVNSIQVMVRSARDPYLNFQYVTDGSETFGLTTGQKVAIGIGCLVAGLVFISFWVLTIYCCCKFMGCCGEHPTEPPSNPVGQFYYGAVNKYGQYIPGYTPQPQPQPQHQQQPYGQPYTGQPTDPYQQPQPYGQPPPQYQYGQGYGAGQPYGGPPPQGQPYGAPPAGYPGQQAQPYGVPPTGYTGYQETYKYN